MTRRIKQIRYSSKFERSYKKLPLAEKIFAEEKEKIFRQNAFDRKLKAHKLKGDLKHLWSFTITYSYRVVFKFVKKDIVLFYDIGDHRIYQ